MYRGRSKRKTASEIKLEPADAREFQQVLTDVCRKSRLLQECKFIQHGTTSVFRHSVAVAYTCFWIARRLNLRIDEKSLIRGALLHDYFLYDWHEKDASHRWHGFIHAERALANALEDFDLNGVERDMIRRHMFPLNVRPPRYKESWILCVADKICSSRETVDGLPLAIAGCGGAAAVTGGAYWFLKKKRI